MTKSLSTECVERCPLCNAAGRPLYRGVPDPVFRTQAKWDFSACPQCDCLWLNPRLTKEDLPKAYHVGYTHYADPNARAGSRLVGRLKAVRSGLLLHGTRRYIGVRGNWLLQVLGSLPPWNFWAAFHAKFLRRGGGKKLLDVGCGNGAYLAMMREAGWDVLGLESDPEAVRVAQEHFKVPVVVGTIEDAHFPAGSFDAITLDNVIEHVPDPVAVLKRCHDLLKPGGLLALRTPNIDSLGHRVFKQNWGPLLPPQHLVLFSPAGLKRAVELAGFQVTRCGTTAYAATSPCGRSRSYFADVLLTKFSVTATLVMPAMLFGAVAFQVCEGLLNALFHTYGEEIGLLAAKPPPR